MSIELPRGWSLAKIPDLVGPNGVFSDGDWVESEDQDPNGDVRLIQLADIGDGNYVNKSNRFLTNSKARKLNCTFLKSGDVLVARMPDPLGRACIFPGDAKSAVTVVDVCVIRSEQDQIDHQWLMHFINSPELRAEINALQSGSTRKRISRGNLSTIPIPTPPRAEQIRIVEKLEELLSVLNAGVAELKAAQRKLTQYRQSLLKAAVEGALTADWRTARTGTHPPPRAGEGRGGGTVPPSQPSPARGGRGQSETGAELLQRILHERRARWEQKQLAKFAEQGKAPLKGWQDKYPEPVAPDLTELPSLPEGWVWASLAQLGETTTGFTPSTSNAEYFGGDVPFFRPTDLDGGYDIREFRDSLTLLGLEQGRLLPEKSVLVTCIGATIGKTGLARVPCATNQQINAVSPVEDGAVSEYLYFVLTSSFGQRQITGNASATTLPILNKSKFEKLPVPMPGSQEQREIVHLLEIEMERVKQQGAAITLALNQAAAQRKNLLKTAFSGQLVPQDPNDEPASALLARIRAQREADTRTPAPKRGHKAKGAA